MLGPWCQPLVVQFSRLLTTLTTAWDPDVRNPLGGAIFYWLEIRGHLLVYSHDLGGSLLSSSPRTIIS